MVVGLSALVLVRGAPVRGCNCQPVAGSSPRRALSAVVNDVAHGQLVGIRSVGRPDRLTSRPGMASSRVRNVRATTSWLSTRTFPAIAVQRIMMCARTAHCNHALLARKLPDGTCSSPAPSFEVADRELDHGVSTVELVDLDCVAGEVGEESEVAPVGPPLQLVLVRQAGAPHDQPTCHRLLAGAGRVLAFGTSPSPSSVYSIPVQASSGIAMMASLTPLLEHLTAIV